MFHNNNLFPTLSNNSQFNGFKDVEFDFDQYLSESTVKNAHYFI